MTAQISENIRYNENCYSMRSNPLGYCDAFNTKAKELVVNCTALWRGYIGDWEVISGRLYLIGLRGKLKNGSDASLDYFFPGFPNRVFAHWYSGRLNIPIGRCIKYVHLGYESKYESELHIYIEQGLVTGTKTVNGASH